MLGVLIDIKIFQIHQGYSISVYVHDTNKLLIQQKNKIKKPAIVKISKKITLLTEIREYLLLGNWVTTR